MSLPDPVSAATERAALAGFALSCEPEVGRLLAVLAAAVPEGGRVLELGTGAGVGTAWLVHGIGSRTDVRLLTVDIDPDNAALAARSGWPSFVTSHIGDGLEALAALGRFDLIFADAPAGKWTGLDKTIAALRPHGVLVVDDMTPTPEWDAAWSQRMKAVRETLAGHADLVTAELDWASGVIVATRRS